MSDPITPATSTRRALLAATVGGVGALAVHAVAGPAPARAADHDAIRAGEVTTATLTTELTMTANNTGLRVRGTGGGAGIGIFGSHETIGVQGESNRTGVIGGGPINGVLGRGDGPTANGVRGLATGSGHGVFGTNGHSDGFAVYGRNVANGTVGALGGQNGVEGQTASAIGVSGRDTGTSGVGVYGTAVASSGTGVYGRNVASGNYGRVGTNNAGVVGHAFQGTAVTAIAHGTAAGLRVTGKNYFDRAGIATVPDSENFVVVSANLDKSTVVLALLLEDKPSIFVRAVVTDDAAETFTILLNASPVGDTKVGYFLIG